MPVSHFPISREDQETVVRLLGRIPRLPFAIVTRCPAGSPQVLQTPPVLWEDERWKPFPTIYWLVCPRLRTAISTLEQGNHVRAYCNRLLEDHPFREAYLAGQRSVAKMRLDLAAGIVGGELPPKVHKILEECSIAGSHDPMGVKCLHAHAAHSLAGGDNPIGREVLSMAGPCREDPRCDRHPIPQEEEA